MSKEPELEFTQYKDGAVSPLKINNNDYDEGSGSLTKSSGLSFIARGYEKGDHIAVILEGKTVMSRDLEELADKMEELLENVSVDEATRGLIADVLKEYREFKWKKVLGEWGNNE